METHGLLPFIKIGRRCLCDWASVQAALLRRQRGGQWWAVRVLGSGPDDMERRIAAVICCSNRRVKPSNAQHLMENCRGLDSAFDLAPERRQSRGVNAEEPAEERPVTRRERSFGPQILGGWMPWILVCIVFYPLSIGPAIRLFGDTPPEPVLSILRTVYTPLTYACRSSPVLDRALMDYAEWWKKKEKAP